MSELVRQASRLQRKIEARKKELESETVEATAGNDRVRAVASGAGTLVSVTIDPELIRSESLELVQDLVVAAANAALARSREMVEKEIDKVTGGLKVPGLT